MSDPPADAPGRVGPAADLAAIYRREVGRCTATLIRVLGDVDLAEDAVAEAFAIATERWPRSGIPPNPGAWITTTARNRAIDRLRRESTRTERQIAATRLVRPETGPGQVQEDTVEPDPDLDDLERLVDVVADDQLRLMFLCCHPALGADAQVALTLRLLGGFETAEIARSFLVPEATIAQRIVRAKRKLRDNRASYRVPPAADLPDRLRSVLAAISLIYTGGHAASGDALVRLDRTAEAIRLGRVLVELMPDEPEAVGLLALMVLTDARSPARTAADGSFVRLSDQDRSRWDRAAIAEGHRLVRACLRRDQPGPYQLQAAIAAVHADAATAEATDWSQIVALYDQLLAHQPTGVVAMNRAVAIAELHGPEHGLAALDQLEPRARQGCDGSDISDGTVGGGALQGYQPFHAARADLLTRAGRIDEALAAYERAIDLSDNSIERSFLMRRRAEVARSVTSA